MGLAHQNREVEASPMEILSRFPMGLAHPVSRQQCKILNAKENISGKNGSPVPDRNAGIALAHAPK